VPGVTAARCSISYQLGGKARANGPDLASSDALTVTLQRGFEMKKRPIGNKAKSVAFSMVQNFHTEKRSAMDAAAYASLHTKIAFALIGCLLALNLMLRFPELGAVIAQYNQF
jgi:hypothetical protein